MNLNIIAYITFLLIITYIIIVVGKICYKNGNVFVLNLLPGHKELCVQINKILLIGYYLTNIGYAATTLIRWKIIYNLGELVETLSLNIALIVGLLSIIHYLNIFLLTKYVKKLI